VKEGGREGERKSGRERGRDVERYLRQLAASFSLNLSNNKIEMEERK